MTKREAMRQVCLGVAALIENDGEMGWLERDDEGRPLSDEDAQRRREARDALVAELRRRGAPKT